MLPHKDGKYLADDNGITSQNTWIFISLCLPTCSHYADLKWNIWYFQDGFSDTPRHLSLSLISRAWIWSDVYFSATNLIFRIRSKISRFYLHYLLSVYIIRVFVLTTGKYKDREGLYLKGIHYRVHKMYTLKHLLSSIIAKILKQIFSLFSSIGTFLKETLPYPHRDDVLGFSRTWLKLPKRTSLSCNKNCETCT
jgi:hypothetical protein